METGSRLTVRAYHVTDVAYGEENRVTVDGKLTVCRETAEEIPSGSLVYALCLNEDASSLELLELQLEGKKRMETADFLRGSGALIREQGQLTAE